MPLRLPLHTPQCLASQPRRHHPLSASLSPSASLAFPASHRSVTPPSAQAHQKSICLINSLRLGSPDGCHACLILATPPAVRNCIGCFHHITSHATTCLAACPPPLGCSPLNDNAGHATPDRSCFFSFHSQSLLFFHRPSPAAFFC